MSSASGSPFVHTLHKYGKFLSMEQNRIQLLNLIHNIFLLQYPIGEITSLMNRSLNAWANVCRLVSFDVRQEKMQCHLPPNEPIQMENEFPQIQQKDVCPHR